MVDSTELAALLRDVPERITAWRAQAEQLRNLVEAARVAGTISDDLLVTVEETATAITDEITSYTDIVADVAEASPEAAAELAPVGEALHLVLMEITEQGTALYAIRSEQPFEVAPQIPPPGD